MIPPIKVDEVEVKDVLEWAETHMAEQVTANQDSTFEEGVYAAMVWMLGYSPLRPDDI